MPNLPYRKEQKKTRRVKDSQYEQYLARMKFLQRPTQPRQEYGACKKQLKIIPKNLNEFKLRRCTVQLGRRNAIVADPTLLLVTTKKLRLRKLCKRSKGTSESGSSNNKTLIASTLVGSESVIKMTTNSFDIGVSSRRHIMSKRNPMAIGVLQLEPLFLAVRVYVDQQSNGVRYECKFAHRFFRLVCQTATILQRLRAVAIGRR